MSFYQLFLANLKILYRNWRGLFWNILLPAGLYIGISYLPFNPPGLDKSTIRYADYLLPGILALTILQTGLFGLAYWLVDLNDRGVIKRFKATPLSNTEFLGSLILSRLFVMIIQVLLLMLLGRVLFNTTLNGSLLASIIILVLGGSIFLSIGFLVSTVSRTYEEASPITSVINMIFIFLGNIFYPTSGLPEGIAKFSSYLPMTYVAEGLRNNFINSGTLYQSLPTILALCIWLAATFMVATTIFRIKQANQV
jgi:ABC-2 type transport system permease protein